jgi:hypothetical protein
VEGQNRSVDRLNAQPGFRCATHFTGMVRVRVHCGTPLPGNLPFNRFDGPWASQRFYRLVKVTCTALIAVQSLHGKVVFNEKAPPVVWLAGVPNHWLWSYPE